MKAPMIVITCDLVGCSAWYTSKAKTASRAIWEASEAGWVYTKDGKDFCPDHKLLQDRNQS